MKHNPGRLLGALLVALCVLGQSYVAYATLAASSHQTLQISDEASPLSASWIPPKTDARDAVAAPYRHSSRLMARSVRRLLSPRQWERERGRSARKLLRLSRLSSRRILHHAFRRPSSDDQPA